MRLLRRVARNVVDLAAATIFYEALGFVALGLAAEDAELAVVLGMERVTTLRLVLGEQMLELTQCAPPGAAYPATAKADDPCFQHIAIVTWDIFVMHRRALRAGAVPISYNGPLHLPNEAGGVFAWKFRDPDAHPLEFLQMPNGRAPRTGALTSGYDHSAICVTDVARSVSFYQAHGLIMQRRHLNHGAAQARLDGLDTSTVEVVAMVPAQAPPHVELLGYHEMMLVSDQTQLNNIAADRLVFNNPSGGLVLQHDPDGHVLLFDGRE